MIIQDIQVRSFYDRSELTIICPKQEIHSINKAVQGIRKGDDCEVTIKKKRKARSLDANAYYWSLCSQLADKVGTSRAEMHNRLLARYGTDWTDEEGRLRIVMIPDTDDYQFDEKTHLRPTSHTGRVNGEVYRQFILIKPSHLYDSKEMSRLIDGLVSEAQEVGITTLTPNELQRLEGIA